jgi:hypothetical protein
MGGSAPVSPFRYRLIALPRFLATTELRDIWDWQSKVAQLQITKLRCTVTVTSRRLDRGPAAERYVVETIQFGAGDNLACPDCKDRMGLTRRAPHPMLANAFEQQTFTCRICKRDIERGVDRLGKAIWKGYLKLRPNCCPIDQQQASRPAFAIKPRADPAPAASVGAATAG